jgi:hypothetical protein
MGFLAWIEQTPLSVWIREAPTLWAFPFILFLHTLGLGFLVGINVAFNLWVLGFAERYPIEPLRRFFPFMWAGLWINALSGFLLLVAYPAKALTDPVFYLKIGLIVIALTQLLWMRDELFVRADPAVAAPISRRTRLVAALTLFLWAGAILTGRLLAYTYNIMLTGDATF